MRPPRSPSLPSAAVGQQLRAHPGEDNGTRTRTPALTTRRLSLRLCPPQDGPSHFRHAGEVVGSRGFEPRSARSERAASADCATSRRCGDHGRIRTATGQALDLLPLPGWATWPLVPPGPPEKLLSKSCGGKGRRPWRSHKPRNAGSIPASATNSRFVQWKDGGPTNRTRGFDSLTGYQFDGGRRQTVRRGSVKPVLTGSTPVAHPNSFFGS